MSGLGHHRMKAILELYSNEQILQEIDRMKSNSFNPNNLWSDQGITNQEWYDGLVLEAITRGISE